MPETVHAAAGDGDLLFGFQVEFGLVAAVRRVFGDAGEVFDELFGVVAFDYSFSGKVPAAKNVW